MSIPPEPRDVPTCATDTIGELPPAAMDGGTNYQNEVAILRAQLAEAAELALRLSCEKGALGKALAEAQRQSKEQAEQLGDYQIAIDTAMVTMGQEDVSPGIVTAAQAMMEQLRQAEREVADLTARLERAEGALRAVLPLAAAHHRHEAETGGYDPISGNWAEEAYQANAKAIAEATALAGQAEAKGEN